MMKNSLVVCVFFVWVLIVNFITCDVQPTHYDKYFTTLLHEESEHPAQRETYFVKDSTRQAVIFEPNSDVNTTLYHIDERDDTSYWVFQITEEILECMKTEVEYEEMDIVDYLLKDIKEYEGSGPCGSGEERECELWTVDYHSHKCLFYEYKDTKTPCCMERVEDKKMIFKFEVFMHGVASFDETEIFRLPMEPDQCQYLDAPKRYPLERGTKYSRIKLVDMRIL